MPRTTPIDPIADPAVAYDDAHVIDLAPEEGGICDEAPAGQHEFRPEDFHRCIHCGAIIGGIE